MRAVRPISGPWISNASSRRTCKEIHLCAWFNNKAEAVRRRMIATMEKRKKERWRIRAPLPWVPVL